MSGLVPQILSILAPGFFLALIGLAWFHRGPPFPLDFVTTLVINVGMPALLFHTLASSSVDIVSLGHMGLATLFVHLVFTAFIVAALKVAKKDWRLCIAHVVGNSGNLGLPICFFAFGDEGLAYAMAYFSVQCLLLFSLGDAVLSGNARLKNMLRSPIVYSIVAGVLVRIVDIELPKFVLDTTELLGQLVIPTMLITLGVSLAGMKLKQLPSGMFWSAVRTVTAVVVGFLVADLFDLQGVAKGVLIIETAVPVAVFNFLLAVRHGRDSAEVSGLILITHLAAIFYLPVLLGLLLN